MIDFDFAVLNFCNLVEIRLESLLKFIDIVDRGFQQYSYAVPWLNCCEAHSLLSAFKNYSRHDDFVPLLRKEFKRQGDIHLLVSTVGA